MRQRFLILACVLFLGAFASAQTLTHAPVQTETNVWASWTAQTTTGATDTANVAKVSPSVHTLALTVTGSPAGCTYRLEGSLDGTTFFDLSGAQTCTSSTMFHVVQKKVTYVRGFLITLSGGSSPTVALAYVGGR